MNIEIWQGCYNESHKGLIVPGAFVHPAKMAVGLCKRIYEHGQIRGYWRPGNTIVDPFYGIGTVGLIGAYQGYQVVGIELEAQFVALAQANIKLHQRTLEMFNHPLPTVVQGDSRELRTVIGSCNGAVTSPPFSVPGSQPETCHQSVRSEMKAQGRQPDFVWGAITSPPYADGCAHAGGDDPKPEHVRGGKYHGVGIAGAISSPPYSDSRIQTMGGNNILDYGRSSDKGRYGEAEGQIGAMIAKSYWSAMALVYRELYELLPTGGAAAIVVKDYVKGGQRVPLCDQTAELLETVGFSVPERCRAMLVKEIHQGTDMFTGEEVNKRVERKSFFRRLAEKKGSPKIDWEEVIWAVKHG